MTTTTVVASFVNIEPVGELAVAVGLLLFYSRICGPRVREFDATEDDWGTHSVSEYEFISITGEGTFGQVYKASCKKSGEICALKKVFQRQMIVLKLTRVL